MSPKEARRAEVPSCPSCGVRAQAAEPTEPGGTEPTFVCANPDCPDHGEVVG